MSLERRRDYPRICLGSKIEVLNVTMSAIILFLESGHWNLTNFNARAQGTA